MTYTRTIKWECEQEYETLEEAEADEDNFLKLTFPSDFPNATLSSNELEED